VIEERAEDDRGWPLHERLLGGATRSGLAAVGFAVPLLITMRLREWPFVAPIVLCFAAAVFLGERRDGSLFGAIARLFVGGAIAGVVSPLAILWIEKLGKPQEAYRELGHFLQRSQSVEAILVMLGAGGFSGIALGLPILVRSRTRSSGKLALAHLVPALLPAGLFVAGGNPAVGGLTLAMFGLAALGTFSGDKLAERFDPSRPLPAEEKTLWPAYVAWLPILLLGGCILFPNMIQPRGHGNEAAAIGALKTIATSQSIFREGDKDGNDVLDYAGSLTELSETQLIDSVLGSGVKQGYTFRLTRSASTPEFLWAAAADPVRPGETGDRHFWTNQAGVIFYTTGGPIPFTDDCQAPKNAIPVGK
jgi:hypothetical protein